MPKKTKILLGRSVAAKKMRMKRSQETIEERQTRLARQREWARYRREEQREQRERTERENDIADSAFPYSLNDIRVLHKDILNICIKKYPEEQLASSNGSDNVVENFSVKNEPVDLPDIKIEEETLDESKEFDGNSPEHNAVSLSESVDGTEMQRLTMGREDRNISSENSHLIKLPLISPLKMSRKTRNCVSAKCKAAEEKEIKRSLKTVEKRAERRQTMAKIMRIKRSLETAAERAERLQKMAKMMRIKRSLETAEERAERLEKQRKRSWQRRKQKNKNNSEHRLLEINLAQTSKLLKEKTLSVKSEDAKVKQSQLTLEERLEKSREKLHHQRKGNESNICGKSFSQKCSLTLHQKIHTEDNESHINYPIEGLPACSDSKKDIETIYILEEEKDDKILDDSICHERLLELDAICGTQSVSCFGKTNFDENDGDIATSAYRYGDRVQVECQ